MSLSNILKAICQRTEKEEMLAVQRLMGKNAKKRKMREGPAEGWEDGKAARQSERRRQRQRKGRGGEEKLC